MVDDLDQMLQKLIHATVAMSCLATNIANSHIAGTNALDKNG